MRFQINIDCSPEEARRFFGVPDLMPLQKNLMEHLNSSLTEQLRSADSETLMKTWMPALFQGWNDMQQAMWKGMSTPDINFNTGETPKGKKRKK
jgi:hypothetical protein